MATTDAVVVRFVVKHAQDLPKTDLFSATDPFFRGETSDGGPPFETKRIDNNANPVYDQAFFLRLPVGEPAVSALGGWVELTLYDEDIVKDSKVGTCRLDFSTVSSFNDLRYQELKIDVKDKYKKNVKGGPPMVAVAIEGPPVLDYGSLRRRVSSLPGALFNDLERRLYLPQAGGRFYLGVEYEKDAVDFKIYSTEAGKDLYLDMFVVGASETKVRRRVYSKGHEVVEGLTAFQEVKLDDVPIGSDFTKVKVAWFDSALISEHSVGAVARHHGWRGALNFDTASQTLHNIASDPKEEEIGMWVDPGAMVIVDWDEDDVDMKLAVIPSAETQSRGYDLTIKDKDIKKTSSVFHPIIHKFGHFPVSRIFELDDVPHGSTLDSMAICQYDLTNMRQASVQDMTGIMLI